MKTLIHLSICLLFTCAVSIAQSKSTSTSPSVKTAGPITNDLGQTIVCKTGSIPDGYVVVGEVFSDQCSGNAWSIKRKVQRNEEPDRVANVGEQPVLSAEVVVNSAKCQAFRKRVNATYNFRPALLSDAQVKVKSAELDSIWNEVRDAEEVLLPCLRVGSLNQVLIHFSKSMAACS